jgi:2,3,4,5-tetrahydropyridine-2-carboxylate N-succinyltransferase
MSIDATAKSIPEIRASIEAILQRPDGSIQTGDRQTFLQFRLALEKGLIRSATPPTEPTIPPTHGWTVNHWVKQGILLGFRLGQLSDQSIHPRLQPWMDKDTYPVRAMTLDDGVRIVPGGTTIRTGAHVARGVTLMPPSYINVGAYVAEDSMVDSHALIGSCAQIGARCHISAAAQIGGVLEPVGALPVIIEDDVLVGGNCGVYEGAMIQRGAILGSGVILTRSTPVVDLVHERIITAQEDGPLVIPPGAVVVPGTRPVRSDYGKQVGVALQCAVIVKYRDDKTNERVQLEQWLRQEANPRHNGSSNQRPEFDGFAGP